MRIIIYSKYIVIVTDGVIPPENKYIKTNYLTQNRSQT